tara:strand:- start:66 stop:371 length:306 start_codon:yes stop_codon:yes gene_type:complete
MKKVINGKMYNTETAKLIETHTYKYPSDFEWFKESLYQKKTGEFFIDGEGGGLSKYAEEGATGGWSYGSKVSPISEIEAKAWVEEHSDVELYGELFGEVSE